MRTPMKSYTGQMDQSTEGKNRGVIPEKSDGLPTGNGRPWKIQTALPRLWQPRTTDSLCNQRMQLLCSMSKSGKPTCRSQPLPLAEKRLAKNFGRTRSMKIADRLKIANVDWGRWQPEETATLMFVVQNNEVLLIRKKRGLGAGKMNGPGGRLEGNETPLQCAIRETQEELCITPMQIRAAGELFHAEDMPRIHAFVFVANAYTGQPTETDEAVPHWTPLSQLPFDEMWEDDRLWLGAALEGQTVRGWFSFVEESLLDYRLELTPGYSTE